MNVPTGEFRALTEQLERLTEQVAGLDASFGQVLLAGVAMRAFGLLEDACPQDRRSPQRARQDARHLYLVRTAP